MDDSVWNLNDSQTKDDSESAEKGTTVRIPIVAACGLLLLFSYSSRSAELAMGPLRRSNRHPLISMPLSCADQGNIRSRQTAQRTAHRSGHVSESTRVKVP